MDRDERKRRLELIIKCLMAAIACGRLGFEVAMRLAGQR
jgi:hypothetical protein